MEITPDKRNLVLLVEQAHKGNLCLPNFQRDFVWKREEVADLVRSVLRGYFVGSLLLLRSDPSNPPFAPVFLRGAVPEYSKPRAEFLVLDGQQRLSSLMYALTAPDLSLKDSTQRRWYFVDLRKWLEDPEDDDVVFDRSKRELRGLDDVVTQFEQQVIPCTAFANAKVFYQWRDGFEDWLRETDPGRLDEYRSSWRDAWTTLATNFTGFQVPLVELPAVDESDPDSIGRVCAIFEKLNSTGVQLSVYDLLTARLYRSNIQLHDLWTQSCADHPLLAAWSKGKADEHKFGVLVLRTLALLRGLDPKPRILIDLSPEGFVEDWKRASAAVERALELISKVGPDGFGVFAEKWLPGFGLIPILAALRARLEEGKLGEAERTQLRRWYWSNVFLERYSSSVESKSRKDYQEMTKHWFEKGPEPEVFSEARAYIGAPQFRVRNSASYASAVYSGVFCLLALGNARDWRRGEDITLQTLQDHHIVPKAYLSRHGITKQTTVNTIVNRTLISDETNGKIKDKAPADYFTDGTLLSAIESPEGLLEDHFISESSIATLKAMSESTSDEDVANAYDEFLDERERMIISEIRRACGVGVGAVSFLDGGLDEDARDLLEADANRLE